MREVSNLILVLPWPPSVNGYWRCRGSGASISAKGRRYRESVRGVLLAEHGLVRFPAGAPLRGVMHLHPPTKRRPDVDNFSKAVLDSLQHGRLFEDDGLVVSFRVDRFQPAAPGQVHLFLETYKGGPLV